MEKSLFNKLIVVLCSSALVLGVSYIKVTPVKAIYNFWVEVSDPNPGAIPTYKFHFSIEKKLEVHKYIKMIFPPGTTYTIPPEEFPPLDPNDPCKACQGLPIIEDLPDGSVMLMFNTHIELDPSKEGYRDIIVTLPSNSPYKFTNPSISGCYTYKISTQIEPQLVESYPVEIIKSTITNPIVDVEAPKVSEIAGFSLDFKTSALGELKPENKDKIRIRFPDGFVFTRGGRNIKMNWILVNDKFLQDYPTLDGRDLILPVPDRIRKGSEVSIKIDCRVGIKTSPNPGSYQLLVSTSKDAAFVPSNYFDLK